MQQTVERPPAVPLSVYVPAELRERFEEVAHANFRSVSAEVRLAMTRHLEEAHAGAREPDIKESRP